MPSNLSFTRPTAKSRVGRSASSDTKCTASNASPRALVNHVFADGRLLTLLLINSNTPGEVISPEDFAPSREAYVSFGSYVEPRWDGDSCRCMNTWAEGNINTSDTKPTGEHQDRRRSVESFGFKEEK